MDPLADYDLPTHVSNTCLPITGQTSIYPEGTHDFVDEKDAKMILGGAGSRAEDDYGVWCNYGNLQKDFNRAYKDGILREHMTDEEWNAVDWDLMKNGDPRWTVEFYRLIAEDTIEEKILRLHATKKSLADALLEGSNMSNRLSKDEILKLLSAA